MSKWSSDRKDKAVLTILGCGIQGRVHLDVFTSLFKWNKVSQTRQNSFLWKTTAESRRYISGVEIHNTLLIYKCNGPTRKY